VKTDVESIVQSADSKCKEVLKQLVKAELNKDTAIEQLEIDRDDILTVARKHPREYAFYSSLLAMVSSAIKQCDTALECVSGELYNYYSKEYAVALKSTEVKYYITHDKDYRKLCLMKDALIDQQEMLKAIVNAFEQRSYAINNVVRLVLMEHERSKYEA